MELKKKDHPNLKCQRKVEGKAGGNASPIKTSKCGLCIRPLIKIHSGKHSGKMAVVLKTTRRTLIVSLLEPQKLQGSNTRICPNFYPQSRISNVNVEMIKSPEKKDLLKMIRLTSQIFPGNQCEFFTCAMKIGSLPRINEKHLKKVRETYYASLFFWF